MIRKITLLLMIVISLAAVGSLFFRHPAMHRLVLTTCFDDVEGLQPGAHVRVAGVDVGRVSAVRAQPEKQACPAEVQVDLATNYELKIPSDAVAEIGSEGLLGPKYVEINTRNAMAAPAANHTILKGMVAASATQSLQTFADRALQAVGPKNNFIVSEAVSGLVRPILDEKQKLESGDAHDEHQINQLLVQLIKKKGPDADEALVVLMCFDLGESGEEVDGVIARGRRMLPLLKRYRAQDPYIPGREYPSVMMKGPLTKDQTFDGAAEAIQNGWKSTSDNPNG